MRRQIIHATLTLAVVFTPAATLAAPAAPLCEEGLLFSPRACWLQALHHGLTGWIPSAQPLGGDRGAAGPDADPAGKNSETGPGLDPNGSRSATEPAAAADR
ncbi:MAG: hypothetical protein AAF481_04780 [Acidobacteriota bacterium]